MAPIPSRQPPHAYDKARPKKPLPVEVTGKTKADTRKKGKVLRTNVCQWGKRRGVLLVVRLVSRSADGLTEKYLVHHDGKRP